ncbi:Stealth protein CR2, conserved region 2 [Pelomyxa schiedti]|nr:Stealth protein CR2, conserved region 2 [Pelomyxa schiedti]
MQEGGGRTWNEYKVCRDIDVQVRYRKGTSWNGMFRDYGVLRFSMRSIAAFMPYVRDVIIVTNGQVPTWLNTSATGIRIVTHKEIFHNSSDLPTFNSNAIEANLHNIPGKMRDTPRTHWVDEETGKIKVYMEGGKAPQADKGGWFKSVAHSNEIINKYYRPNENRSNPTRHHYVGHYCYFTLTEIADLMYSRWQSEFDRTSHNKFRQNNDTAFPFLNANVALEENQAIISKAPNGHSSWTSNTTKNTKTWDTIMSRSPFCVCLQDRFNDNATAVDIEIAHLESLLCETFPSPSRFERMDVSNPCSNVQKH